MSKKNHLSVLLVLAVSAAFSIVVGTPAQASVSMTSCSFSADAGATYTSDLVVPLTPLGTANILTQVSPAGSVVKWNWGFVPRPDRSSPMETAGLFVGMGEPYLNSAGAYTITAPDKITGGDPANYQNPTNYQYWDVGYLFFDYVAGSFLTPETHFVEYRYYNADTNALMCSITVDFSATVAPTAVNYGHSDKTAAPSDRNRLYFSTDPSGPKPKK